MRTAARPSGGSLVNSMAERRKKGTTRGGKTIGALAMLVLGVLLYPYIYMLTTVLYFRLVELKEGGVVAVEETVIVEEDAGPPPAV